ncbi:MAG: DUF4296 domain-containing protein [Muribaculaceae bacterium]|nr:DUF4296 domain-containing protein [Muribaculaceae bacterium]
MRRSLSIYAIMLLAAVSCSKTPKGIIPPEQMAQLMADIHTGEAVIELNRGEYRTDSMKQALKQSVYARHGVDAATVDSSYLWYGRNINSYLEVYDRTIEILEHRLIESGNRVAAEAALSVAGDSVDVWPYPRYVAVNDRMPSKTLAFSFARDENWKRGDMYVWRVKAINNPSNSRWSIVAEYSDGDVDYLSQEFSGDGWKEIVLYTDSLRDATRVYGHLLGANPHGTSLRFDSIEMVRKRVDPSAYGRRYSVRRLHGLLPAVEIEPDEAATDSVPEEGAERK